MKIIVETDEDIYEITHFHLFSAFEKLAKGMGMLAEDETLQVLNKEERYVLDKLG